MALFCSKCFRSLLVKKTNNLHLQPAFNLQHPEAESKTWAHAES